MTATRALSEFVATLEWRGLPNDVTVRTKELLLDVLGVACAGVEIEAVKSARRAAASWGKSTEATVIGRRWRLPAQHAAFVNAFAARIHTYDDTYEPGTVHPGSAVIAAALAASEKVDAKPSDFLAAVVAGYEVAARVAAAVSPSHYAHGFHNTGTCNAFGAAAAAARAMRLSADATEQVLGLAAATAAGIRQHQLTGSMADTALHGARAAQTGVSAADLQRSGLAGPTAILDGDLGFCRVMCPEPNLAKLDDGLGSRFEFLRTTIKPYPSCRFTHGPIDAAIALRRQHEIDPAQIERVEVRGFRQSMEVSNRPKPKSRTDRILSHQYTVAEALLRGSVGLSAFDDEQARDAELSSLVDRIDASTDQQLDALYPSHQAHRVIVTLSSGDRLEAFREDPPGGAADPLPARLLSDKFMGLAVPVLGVRHAGSLVKVIADLEREPNLLRLTRALRPGAKSATKNGGRKVASRARGAAHRETIGA